MHVNQRRETNQWVGKHKLLFVAKYLFTLITNCYGKVKNFMMCFFVFFEETSFHK